MTEGPAGGNVLIVEDDEGLARLEELRLRRAGHSVSVATTAEAGLRRVEQGGVDLLLLDQKLPNDVSGLDFYRQVKAAGFDTPAILVTGFTDEGTILDALRAGVRDFIAKAENYLEYLVPAVDRVLREVRIERQLAASEALLARMIHSAMDAVLTVDGDGRVDLFNAAAERIFACPAAGARGRDVRRFIPAWPESPDGHFARLETDGLRADGVAFPLEASISRDAVAGREFRTCFARDISDRKQAEEERARLIREQAARAQSEAARAALEEAKEQYRVMGETLPYGVWMCGPDGGMLYASRSFRDLLGMSLERAQGAGWADRLAPGTAGPTLERWRRCVASGEPWEAEYRFETPDGPPRTVLSRGRPVRDPAGRITSWVGINLDITERKRDEEALKEADRRKDEFLAMLAHELRNPLSSISTALQLARRQPSEEHRLWSQEVIGRQVTNLTHMIDDLLDVSRINLGKIRLRAVVLDAAAVVDRAVEVARPVIDARHHALTVSRPGGTLAVEADPTRLEQILVNLLTNAAKYTEDGGSIWLSAAREGADVAFRVRDTGVGLTPEMLARVFDLFAQVDGSLDRSQGGLGIGLTLVKTLAEMHGGTVSATSDGPGLGSEFVVRLPASAAPAPSASPGAHPSAPGPAPGRKLRLLIVDDNLDTARAMARFLALAGHDVRAVHDGPSAVDAARAHRPDAVLLDIGLPGMDGYQVAELLRRDPRCATALLVAVSGYGQDHDRRRSREAGFDHHLVKPLDFDTLQTLLSRLPSHPDPGSGR